MRTELYHAETLRIAAEQQALKAHGHPVPTSAHDAFASLVTHGLLDAAALPQWNAVIGLRNRLVHDYMNVNMAQVLALLAQRREWFVVDFLLARGS